MSLLSTLHVLPMLANAMAKAKSVDPLPVAQVRWRGCRSRASAAR